MSMNKESREQIAEYIMLSSEVFSELASERDALLHEKEALEKQSQEVLEIAPFSDEEIDEVVTKMTKVGFMKESETDEARRDIKKNPSVILKIAEELLDREAGSGIISLGDVDSGNTKTASISGRESDRVYNERFSN